MNCDVHLPLIVLFKRDLEKTDLWLAPIAEYTQTIAYNGSDDLNSDTVLVLSLIRGQILIFYSSVLALADGL
jgi:hypothetical protein